MLTQAQGSFKVIYKSGRIDYMQASNDEKGALDVRLKAMKKQGAIQHYYWRDKHDAA